MYISLQQLELRTVPFDVIVPASASKPATAIEYDGTLTQASDLVAKGTASLLSQAVGEIRLQGQLSVTMTAPCDRCLETATVPIQTPFDLVYLPSQKGGGGEQEIDQGAIEVGFYEGSGIELNDVLREVVLLAMPMQLVCSEACRGICPVCGSNRTEHDCGCRPVTADDRWSKLKELRTEVGPRS